jgi:hypothetical protein
MAVFTKINIKDYPSIQNSVLSIKRKIKSIGVDKAFKPEEDEYGGQFGVQREIEGKNVTMWLPKHDMIIQTYKIGDAGYQLATHLDKSIYRLRRVAYVDVISSIPRKATKRI